MFKVGVWLAMSLFCGAPSWAQQPSKRPAEVNLIISIQGKDLFKSYCASCHGLDAKGKGPMAASLKVPPSNLRRISIRNRDVFPMMRVQKIISGEELQAGHGSSEMPVWGPIFSRVTTDVDLGRVRIDNLARYLRDIQDMK
jgi:mono/diheme cytochrome c family protein